MSRFIKDIIWKMYYLPVELHSPILDFYFKQVTIDPYVKEKIDYVKLGRYIK